MSYTNIVNIENIGLITDFYHISYIIYYILHFKIGKKMYRAPKAL